MSFQYIQPFMGLSSGLQTTQVSGAVGGWVELGRTTLGSTNSNIDVSSLPDKRYYQVLCYAINSGNIDQGVAMGNGSVDTGSNYARRRSVNGATDSTSVSSTIAKTWSTDVSYPMFFNMYLSNLSGKEKLGIHHLVTQNTSGAGTAPERAENVLKWANTTNPLDVIRVNETATGNFASGSEVVVLGWDEADTHTNNFWEELADVDVTTGTSISTGTFSAKKYLWVQFYLKSTAISFDWRFNSDSGTNYSARNNNNGGTEYTQVSKNILMENAGLGAFPHFGNMFIINNSANEKLVTGHLMSQRTSGAANAPQRMEWVGKWTNTADQITDITMLNSTNVQIFKMKVWGAN
jgi:hypothetical protein